ncbi:MAG TPA: DUF2279 domain-containing protein [Chitinophagaceae bacterium]|nr:DUF2279 domain-containing protein [Chitinophagaceae bacterium]
MRSILIFIYLSVSAFAYSQDSAAVKIDTFHDRQLTAAGYKIYPYNKKRVRLVTAANIIGYSAVSLVLNSAWYANQPRSKFHFFNDNAEWLQVDKIGHAYGAYIGSRASNELWRWSGLERKKRIWISGLSGVAYESIIETLDGFSAEYGWSWGDFASNVFGSGLFIAQELAWDEQRIKFKFSFHKRNYDAADLNGRADAIFGKSESERFIKDYNAITDWLSVDIKSFFPKVPVPKWFAIALGYGAEGMFGARSNIGRDKNGNIIFDRSDIKRYRQWFLAPDIDLTKIKTNKKALRLLFSVLSAFKFPAPSLEFSNGSFKGHWIHF